MCIVLCNDLMFGSRIASVLRELDRSFVSVMNEDSLKERADESTKEIIVDLADLSDITGTISYLSSRYPQVRITAFAPHVHTERLAQAEQAGIHRVLTRGQFDAQLSTLFT